jgi:hypothetical protein
VNYIWQKVAVGEKNATLLCLCLTCSRKSDIDPTGKEIECVPFGFAVAQED